MNIVKFLLNVLKEWFVSQPNAKTTPAGPSGVTQAVTKVITPPLVTTPAAKQITFIEEQETRLAQLYPPFAVVIRQFLQAANEAGMPVAIFEGLRPFERQQELYAQGRDKNGNVIDKSKVVTNAIPGMSYHQYGIAADLVFNGDPSKPTFQWSWDDNLPWQRLATLGRDRFGLEPGYFWKVFPDTPHYQITYGLQLQELITLYKQGGLKLIWDKISGK